jgi:hypothetical protein
MSNRTHHLRVVDSAIRTGVASYPLHLQVENHMIWQMVAGALAEAFLNVQVRKRRWVKGSSGGPSAASV